MSEQNPAPNSETSTAAAPPNIEATSSIDHTVEPQHGEEEVQEEQQEVKEVKT